MPGTKEISWNLFEEKRSKTLAFRVFFLFTLKKD